MMTTTAHTNDLHGTTGDYIVTRRLPKQLWAMNPAQSHRTDVALKQMGRVMTPKTGPLAGRTYTIVGQETLVDETAMGPEVLLYQHVRFS